MSERVQHGEVESILTGAGPRSPEWRRVERAHLARQPHCVCCKPGTHGRAPLQVHHIFPFHYFCARPRYVAGRARDRRRTGQRLEIGHIT